MKLICTAKHKNLGYMFTMGGEYDVNAHGNIKDDKAVYWEVESDRVMSEGTCIATFKLAKSDFEKGWEKAVEDSVKKPSYPRARIGAFIGEKDPIISQAIHINNSTVSNAAPVKNLRDEFAMAALGGSADHMYSIEQLAERAYQIADAMMEARGVAGEVKGLSKSIEEFVSGEIKRQCGVGGSIYKIVEDGNK